MKGSFLIKTQKENIITEKGVRAFIVERLLNSSFINGSVFNVDEKTVEVQLEGDESKIKKFIEKLHAGVLAKFGNPVITFSHFRENPSMEIPKLMRVSQALMVGQLQKGIDVQLSILETLKTMNQELKEGFKSMGSDLKGELKSMNQDLVVELKSIPIEIGKILKEK